MRSVILAVLMTVTTATEGWAWGEEGHRAVADAARQLSLTPETREAITKLLGNDDMAAVAVWLDEVRQAKRNQGPLVHDPEAKMFNQQHPNNAEWHFVNLPLSSATFSTDPSFAGPEKVAIMINQCIKVLETPGKKKTVMTKTQALRTLIHLVGDIHQPLHVSSGYYDFGPDGQATLISDPVKAKGAPSDQGGNLLHWGPGKIEELHGDWDFAVVQRILGRVDFQALAAKLAADAQGKNWALPGDYHRDWSVAWALDALRVAEPAYADVKFGRASFNTHQALLEIEIQELQDRDTYLNKHAADAVGQLTKAAGRLSTLLNQIKWK